MARRAAIFSGSTQYTHHTLYIYIYTQPHKHLNTCGIEHKKAHEQKTATHIFSQHFFSLCLLFCVHIKTHKCRHWYENYMRDDGLTRSFQSTHAHRETEQEKQKQAARMHSMNDMHLKRFKSIQFI